MKLCKDGWPFVSGCAGVAAGFLVLGVYFVQSWMVGLAGVGLLAGLFCAWFFRDPKREIPANDRWLLSPADGKILDIAKETDPATGKQATVVRIFLSVFDPHLQRSPLRGRVKRLQYTAGKFWDARDPRAAVENERNMIVIEPASGGASVTVIQIAGLIARRILCWVKEGQTVAAGDYLGLIRFGSQVDLTVPDGFSVKVRTGDRVKAGESVIAERAG